MVEGYAIGEFGDMRLKKGERICVAALSSGTRCACVGWERAGVKRCALDGFCATGG
jgi:hypothetical protein